MATKIPERDQVTTSMENKDYNNYYVFIYCVSIRPLTVTGQDGPLQCCTCPTLSPLCLSYYDLLVAARSDLSHAQCYN